MRTDGLFRRLATLVITLSLSSAALAQVDAVWTPRTKPSTKVGKYCGGDAPTPVGGSLDLNAYCRTLYGASSSAASIKQDAYGWVCKVSGQSDHELDMHRACRQSYGDQAVAALVGLGIFDWRCIRPGDVNGKVVPILLVPAEKMRVSEAPSVTAALRRLDHLMGGIRKFYREKSGRPVRATTAFVLLTHTNASDWQNLAIATDHPSGAFPLDRFAFLNRVKKELSDQRWNVLLSHSSVRLGGFAWLGSSPGAPTHFGAGASGPVFAQAPSVAYATCSSGALNPPAYENAFYAAAHEFGHTMGLPHTDQYLVTALPSNWRDSVMYTGLGTDSQLFPQEVLKLLTFLNGW